MIVSWVFTFFKKMLYDYFMHKEFFALAFIAGYSWGLQIIILTIAVVYAQHCTSFLLLWCILIFYSLQVKMEMINSLK